MMSKRRAPWMRLGWNAWMLGAEACHVVALRGLKFATGGDLDGQEARRMVVEKIEAAQALQMMALTGALGVATPVVLGKTLKHYRRKVQANRRRLRH